MRPLLEKAVDDVEVLLTANVAYRDHPGLLGWTLGNEVWGLLKHHYGQPYLTRVRHAHG